MRQIDIFRKVIRHMQISTVFPKPYTRTHKHTHLLPEVTRVDIINTMNPQNGRMMETTTLPSPLPTRQLFSAGAHTIETRTKPTRTADTGRQSTGAIDNDCININIATYNIRDGRNSNLEAALRACKKMQIDVGILTETRLSTDRYKRSAFGYTVFATQTTHINQGGIALIITNSLYFQIESQQKHGPNVVSCILVTGT
jgi:hypothetical protein